MGHIAYRYRITFFFFLCFFYKLHLQLKECLNIQTCLDRQCIFGLASVPVCRSIDYQADVAPTTGIKAARYHHFVYYRTKNKVQIPISI